MRYEENFEDKYTKANFLKKKLINNFYNQIESLAKDINCQNALEIGCGHGFSTQYLKKIFKNLEASDIEQRLVDDAKKNNPEINIKTESIYQLDRQTNSFDLVIALEVLEHLDHTNQAIQELQRVTKKYCLISVPNEPLWRFINILKGSYLKDWGNTPGHINHWSTKSFVKMLSEYFDIIAIKKPLPWTMVLTKKK